MNTTLLYPSSAIVGNENLCTEYEKNFLLLSAALYSSPYAFGSVALGGINSNSLDHS